MKNVIKGLVFSLLAVITIVVCMTLIVPSTDVRDERVFGYKQKCNQNLDVIAFGNSDLYSGFIPSVLYDQYGLTSYNSGKSRIHMGEQYKIVKDYLKNNNPDLVIFEVDLTIHEAGKVKRSKLEKTPMVRLYKNHDYWRSESASEIIDMKGYVYSDKSKAYDGDINEYMNINEKHFGKDNFKKLKELKKMCDKKDIEFMLLELPSVTVWSHDRHNQMQEFADNEGIKFLDFNVMLEESTLDFNLDSKDGGNHLNVYGAIKTTNIIGKFINDNYNITPNGENDSFIKAQRLLDKKLGYSYKEILK